MSTETAQAFADSCGIEMTAEFVPHSESRNKGNEPSLNWRVKLAKGNVTLETDYMQGCGHLPMYQRDTRFWGRVDGAKALKQTCETGRLHYRQCGDVLEAITYTRNSVPPPALVEVLYGLVTDSDAIDYDFEEWASNFGYDTDSRAAEKIFNACREIGLKLRRMIDLDAAREAYQDY